MEKISKNDLNLAFNPSSEVCKFFLGAHKPSISIDKPKFDIRNEMGIATSRLLLTAEEAFKAVTDCGYSQLKISWGISVGNTTDILIFEVNEPPSYPIDKEAQYESLIYSSYSLETVIINGEAVLDEGVPLNVGTKDIEEANRKVEEIGKIEKNLDCRRYSNNWNFILQKTWRLEGICKGNYEQTTVRKICVGKI